MSSFFVAPIAEGKGEVEAVPKLLQRMFREVRGEGWLNVNPVLRVKAGSFLNDDNYFRRYFELAARKAKPQPKGSVLILLDCEDSCPKTLGPVLLERARNVRPDIPITVALAYREYESWFIAAAQSLRGVAGLPNSLTSPPNPEAIRGAKEWLGRHLPDGYEEINHQPLFTERFAFEQAAVSDSFVHLRRRMHALFT